MINYINRIRANREAMWWLRYACRWALVILALIVYTIVVSRVARGKAIEEYRGIVEETQRVQRLEIDQNAGNGYTLQLTSEAEALARVLYGVKDNDTDDLRTLCWCVINRVDNPAYPGSVEEVIEQPQQWMGYSPGNPVLENLYRIAYAEISAWRSGEHRPCSDEYVFMAWTPSDIVLRNEFTTGSGTLYWRYT